MADAVTTHAKAITVDLLDAEIMAQLRSLLVMAALVRHVDFGGNKTKKLRKEGSVTATTAAEGTAHTRTDYTQTSPATLTVGEVKVYLEQSDLNRDFSPMTTDEIVRASVQAIQKKVDGDAAALFAGFSQSVGTTGVDLTPAVLRTAIATLEIADVPNPYAVVLHPTQVDNINAALLASPSPVWALTEMSILNGKRPELNGQKGTFLGVPVFSTTNVATANSAADYVGAAIGVGLAIAMGEDGRGVRTELGRSVSEGLTEIGVNIYFDVKEAEDLAGVKIISAV